MTPQLHNFTKNLSLTISHIKLSFQILPTIFDFHMSASSLMWQYISCALDKNLETKQYFTSEVKRRTP